MGVRSPKGGCKYIYWNSGLGDWASGQAGWAGLGWAGLLSLSLSLFLSLSLSLCVSCLTLYPHLAVSFMLFILDPLLLSGEI